MEGMKLASADLDIATSWSPIILAQAALHTYTILESTLMVDWVLRFFNHVINVYGTLGLYNFSINHPISCGQRTKSCAAVLHVLCFHLRFQPLTLLVVCMASHSQMSCPALIFLHVTFGEMHGIRLD